MTTIFECSTDWSQVLDICPLPEDFDTDDTKRKQPTRNTKRMTTYNEETDTIEEVDFVASEIFIPQPENSDTEIFDSSSGPSSPQQEEEIFTHPKKKMDDEESEYEKQRRNQIAQNMKYFAELGLTGLIPKPTAQPKLKKRKIDWQEVTGPVTVRRSTRQKVSTTEKNPSKVDLEELDMQLAHADPSLNMARGRVNKKTVYAGRIYSVEGVTCHQCRQKTMDPKSKCCREEPTNPLSRHHYCAACLLNRYGEVLEEVLQNPEWVCPTCKKTCNCSHCRSPAKRRK